MITRQELHDKYSTGVRHISPVAIRYEDSAPRSAYICKAHFGTILRDYLDHLAMPPTDRCRKIPISYDSVIRSDMDIIEEEIEWASIEYILRNALDKFFGVGNFVEFIIIIKEN